MSLYGLRNYRRVNPQIIAKALEKLEKNELTVEDILDEEEYVFDLKSTSYSHLAPCINKEKMMKMIDFIIIEPKDDEDARLGYKFPYNACDILSSENLAIVDKFFEEEAKSCNGKKTSCADDENDNFDNENDEFKAKIINENVSKEKNEKIAQEQAEESHNKEESNEQSNPNEAITIHMEPDNNMKISAERLLVFEEINTEEKKQEAHEEIKKEETNQDKTNEYVSINVTQDQEQLPPNESHNPEVHYIISEDNYFSNEGKKTQQDNKQETQFALIDHLLKFVDTDEPLNYVLSGYFSKIFLNLLNLKTNNFLKYIFTTKKEFLNSLIKHSKMKSISDIILKILNTSLSEIDEEELKVEVFSKVLDAYSNQNWHDSSNICDLILELVSNKNIYYMIVKNEILLRKLYSLTKLNNDKNKEILKMLTKMNESILKDIAGTATSINYQTNQNFWMQMSNFNMGDEESKENYLELDNFNYIFDILDESVINLISQFFNDEENYSPSTSNSKANRVLGLKKIYQVEYFKSVLEILLNANSSLNYKNSTHLSNLIKSVVNSAFYIKITEYFFIFEWNNMFQKAYESVIVLSVNRFSPDALVQLIFQELKLLDLFISHIFDKNFTFESGRKIFNGNLSFICELTVAAHTSENVHLRRLIEQNEIWKEFYISFAKPIKDKFVTGMQLPKEGFFEEGQETRIQKPVSIYLKKENEKTETMIEIYYRCKGNLSFISRSAEKGSSEDTNDEKVSLNASPMKNNFNYQIYDDVPSQSTSPEGNVSAEYFDNNYWNTAVSDFNFEIN